MAGSTRSRDDKCARSESFSKSGFSLADEAVGLNVRSRISAESASDSAELLASTSAATNLSKLEML